jgi:septal ring factor EnvC (AmiA/AmiB activator)
MSDKTPTLADVLAAIGGLDLALRGELGQLRGELGQLRGDLMARLDRHEDRLTAIREDIAVNFNRADRAVDAVKGLRTELDHLSTEFAGMTRQVRRLQTQLDEINGRRA